MCLKRLSYLFVLTYIFFFLPKFLLAEDYKIDDLVSYLKNLENFSASFIQDNGDSISEGKLYIGVDRVRVEYYEPSNILIIMDDNKAMYYNYDLEEDEFFDPKDTNAGFFYDIFNKPEFFFDAKKFTGENFIILEKRDFNEDNEYELKVSFESSPLMIRKIQLVIDSSFINISIFNHNHNQEYDKSFFKLISPTFFN